MPSLPRAVRGFLIASVMGLALSREAYSQTPPAPKPSAAAAPSRKSTGSTKPVGAGTIIVDIAGLENAKGQVLGAIFRGEKGFPNQVKYAIAQQKIVLRDKRASFVFEGIAPGEFAFAVHHDENSNFKMETGMFGIPSEGYATSRDAKPNFGPPSYSDARLQLAAGETKRIVVHMRY